MRAFCLRCDACQKKCALISSLCNTKVFLWKSAIIRILFFSPFTLAALCGVAISTTERNRSWRIRYDRQIYTALAETALEMFSKEGITTPLSIVVLFNLPRRYDTSSDWSTIRNWIAWYAVRTFVHMFWRKACLMSSERRKQWKKDGKRAGQWVLSGNCSGRRLSYRSGMKLYTNPTSLRQWGNIFRQYIDEKQL